MPDIAQQDMSYQPATKGYSFSTNPAAPVNPKLPRKPINWNFLLVLLGEITGLILIFLVILGVLNYFNIISLSKIYPNQLGWLPQATQSAGPTYDSKTSLWTANGTFYGYNQYVIQIKINSKITNFQWIDNNSTAALFNSAKDIGSLNYVPTSYTLFDLEQSQTLGKKVIIQYEIQNGKNVIDSLNLFRL